MAELNLLQAIDNYLLHTRRVKQAKVDASKTNTATRSGPQGGGGGGAAQRGKSEASVGGARAATNTAATASRPGGGGGELKPKTPKTPMSRAHVEAAAGEFDDMQATLDASGAPATTNSGQHTTLIDSVKEDELLAAIGAKLLVFVDSQIKVGYKI